MDNYGYLSGVIKHKEQFLLNVTDIERMANADTANSAFKVFNATDYSDNLLDVEIQNFQHALDDDLKQIRDLLSRHLEPDLFKLLFLRYDAHNIKLFFKAKYSSKNLDKYISNLGIEKPETIKSYILKSDKEETKLEIDGNIKHIIEKTNKFIGKRPFPHRIDYIIDREYFHILYRICENLKNSYLSDLVKLQIDVANLKILIRAKITDKPYEFAEKKFIQHGGIEIENLKILYAKKLEESIDYFNKYFNNKELKNVFDNFKQDNGSFWKIEKALENLEMDYIKKIKFIAYGPEVPVGYYYAKKNAIRNVRLIMTGKINNISNEEINERLRNIY